MKKVNLILFCIFINAYYLSAGNVNVNPVENGVNIAIKDLTFNLKHIKNNRFQIKLNTDKYVVKNTNIQYLLDEIRFIIAVPEKGDLKSTIKNISYQHINNKELAINEEYIGQLNTNTISKKISISNGIPDDLEHSIEIKRIGVKRGVSLALVRIQPFDYNNLTKELSYINNLDLEIIFPENVALNDKNEIAYNDDLSYYSGIDNPEHIKTLFENSCLINGRQNKDLELANNNWYDPQKKYVRLITTKDGIAYCTGKELINTLTEFKNKKIDNFHLIFKGKEVPFNFINNQTGFLSESDSILFYGRRCQGDTTWFENYSFEASFFMYYDESSKGLRFNEYPIVNNASLQIDNININQHLEKENIYWIGTPQESVEAEPSEGWYYKLLYPLDSYEQILYIHPSNRINDSIEISAVISGCRGDWSWAPPDFTHEIKISLNGAVVETRKLQAMEKYIFKIKKSCSDLLDGANSLIIESLGLLRTQNPDTACSPDLIGIDFYTVTGKVKPIAIDGKLDFFLDTLNNNSIIKYKGLISKNVWSIDTLNSYLTKLPVSDNSSEQIFPAGYSSNIFVQQEDSIEKSNIYSVNSTNLMDAANQADVFIITHKDFRRASDSLASYRKSTNPEYNFKVIDVDDLYKEFVYGIKTPHAIKDFLTYSYKKWKSPKPKYVILMGKANWDSRMINPNNNVGEFPDYVPAYGWPSTDYWYALIDGNDFLPDIYIGRIPVITEESAFRYIDKLILNDSLENNSWMKKFLMVSGGSGAAEMKKFYDIVKYEYCEQLLMEYSGICPDTAIISKLLADANVDESNAGKIINEINEGNIYCYFFGHGSPTVFDVDGWEASKLNNKGKYGYLATFACNSAFFADPGLVSRNEEYVLIPEKGFIGSFGSVGVTNINKAEELGNYMLQALYDTSLNPKTYIETIWKAKTRMIYDIWDSISNMDFVYFGDPLVKLKFNQGLDLYLLNNDTKFINSKGGNILSEGDDSAKVTGILYNMGHRLDKLINLAIIETYNEKSDTTYQNIGGICNPVPYSLPIKTYGRPGTHTIKIIADPLKILNDVNRKNNELTYSFEVYSNGLYPVDPLSGWNINITSPRFRMINPLDSNTNLDYDFKIFSYSDTNSLIIKSSVENEITRGDGYIDWLPIIKLNPNSIYWFSARLINKADGNKSPFNLLPFNTFSDSTNLNVDYKILGKDNVLFSGKLDSLVVVSENILLGEEPKEYLISGVYGGNRPRSVDIVYDNKIYITSAEDIGIKLLRISGKDLSVLGVRRYDTYYGYTDSLSAFMVRYLRDTVETGDYVFLATYGVWLYYPSHFPKEDLRSIDSIRGVLKDFYGSKVTDSLIYGLEESYAFLGRKLFNPDSTLEVLRTDGDTALIKGHLTKYYMSGSYISQKIGPAKYWKKLRFDGVNNPFDSAISIGVFGINSNSKQLIKSFNITNSNYDIDLSDINPITYPYLAIELKLNRNSENQKPSVNAINCSFIPTPEFYLSKNKSGIQNNNLLRGDSANLFFDIKNLSLRSPSDSNNININISSIGTASLDNINSPVPGIPKDKDILLNVSAITDNYDLHNSVSAEINSKNTANELYNFNNSTNFRFSMFEDTTPPQIVLKIDGMQVNTGDYVSMRPFVEVDLYDNSHLPITSVKYLGVGINSQPYYGNRDTVFTSYGRNIPLKAKLTFFSDTLNYINRQNQNYIKIYASDVTGNKDTLLVYLYVSQNGFVDSLISIPNPFISNTNINFTLKSPDRDNGLNIKIFNSTGKSVRNISQSVITGKNEIPWDGKDDWGVSVPQGVYTFVVLINSSIYFDPVYGKVILMK